MSRNRSCAKPGAKSERVEEMQKSRRARRGAASPQSLVNPRRSGSLYRCTEGFQHVRDRLGLGLGGGPPRYQDTVQGHDKTDSQGGRVTHPLRLVSPRDAAGAASQDARVLVRMRA